LLTGSLVGIAYLTEFFIAWWSGDPYEQFAFINRVFGPYGWAWCFMFGCNAIVPQVFWVRKLRRNPAFIWVISIFINIGMWFERFVIIVVALHRDFLPSSWAMFSPTWVDISIYVMTFGLFFTCFLLFAKYLPVIAIAEEKAILKSTRGGKPEAAMVGRGKQDYDPQLAWNLVMADKAANGHKYATHDSNPGNEGFTDPLEQGGGENE